MSVASFSLLDLPSDLGESTGSMRSSGRDVGGGGAVGGEHGDGGFLESVGFEHVGDDGGEGDEGSVSMRMEERARSGLSYRNQSRSLR